MPARGSRKIAKRRADGPPGLRDGEAAARSLAARVRQIAFILVLFGAMLGPFVPTLENNFVARLIVQTLFVLGAALWVMSMALEGRVRIRRMGALPWLAVLAGALLSGVVNASYKYSAMLTAFSWFSAMAAFFFIVNETGSRRARLLILAAMGASAFCVALHGLHQLVVELPDAREAFERDAASLLRSLNLREHRASDFQGRLGTNRIFGTFLLPNSLAGYLVLILPVFVGLCVDRFRAWLRPASLRPVLWRAVFLLPLFAAAFFTGSKAGWLALFAALTVFIVWGFRDYLKRRRLHAAGIVLSLLIVVAISQASGLLPPLRDYVGSSGARVGYWRGAVLIFEKHPYVGVGLDNFGEYYSACKRPEDEEARRVHNDYLQLACETGLLGLLAYGAFLLAYWHGVLRPRAAGPPALAEPPLPKDESPPAVETRAMLLLAALAFAAEALCGGTFRSAHGWVGWTWPLTLWLGWAAFFLIFAGRKDAEGPSRRSLATIGMAAGIVGFLAHSLVDFNHYVGGLLETAWLLMGLLLAARLSDEKKSFCVDRPIGPAWRLCMTLGATAVMMLLLYGFVLPLADASVLRAEAVSPSPRLPFAARLRKLERAIERNPWDAQLHAYRSDVLLAMWMTGRTATRRGSSPRSEAILSVQRAVAINPRRAEYATRLGRLYELRWRETEGPEPREDRQKAIETYQHAEILFPTDPDISLALGRIHDLSGNYAAALVRYVNARRLHDEQIRSREFTPAELAELDRRILEIKTARMHHAAVPPLRFTEPRLVGLPDSTQRGSGDR